MTETVTKTAPASHQSERVLEALSTLAALLDRTISEVKYLDGDFQARLLQSLQDTEARVREEVTAELSERFQQELQSVLEASRNEFETERERPSSSVSQAAQTAAHLQGDRERLNRDLNQAVEAASQLEAERSRLKGEIRSIREHADAEIEKARRAAESAVHAARATERSAPPEIHAEIDRVESKIREISAAIEDPSTEL